MTRTRRGGGDTHGVRGGSFTNPHPNGHVGGGNPFSAKMQGHPLADNLTDLARCCGERLRGSCAPMADHDDHGWETYGCAISFRRGTGVGLFFVRLPFLGGVSIFTDMESHRDPLGENRPPIPASCEGSRKSPLWEKPQTHPGVGQASESGRRHTRDPRGVASTRRGQSPRGPQGQNMQDGTSLKPATSRGGEASPTWKRRRTGCGC